MTPWRLHPSIGSDDHIRGNPDAPVTLVEYGDFECPACAMTHAILDEVISAAGPRLRFVFRHFPLPAMHRRALIAAEAAEAAAGGGKFWEMHDLLFLNQDALDPDDLIGYAAALGLDVHRFIAAMEGRVYEARVQRDVESGSRSGVHATPTFFLDGVRWDGPREVNVILAAVNEAAMLRRQ